MVCCVFISFLIAGLICPLRAVMARLGPKKTPALLWRLDEAPISAPSASSQFSYHKFSHPKFSFGERVKSFGYAIEGLGFVIRNEHNARVHIAAALFIIAMGIVLKISPQDWIVLTLAITSVWFAETINTAFEYVCDVVSPEKNESVKRAKDIAAGAVLITAIGAVIIGAFVMFPYIAALFSGAHSEPNFKAIFANHICSAV